MFKNKKNKIVPERTKGFLNDLFIVENTLSNLYDGVYCYPTCKMASSVLADNLQRLGLHLEDYKLYKIGTWDRYSPDINIEDKELIPWNVRTPVERNLDKKESK